MLHHCSVTKILELHAVEDAIEILLNEQKEYICIRPSMPWPPVGGTLTEYQEYTNPLAVYENNKNKYNKESTEVLEYNNSILNKIEELIKFDVKLNKLPPKTAAKVWNHAWESGHSSGYLEVYYHLQELMELFEEFI